MERSPFARITFGIGIFRKLSKFTLAQHSAEKCLVDVCFRLKQSPIWWEVSLEQAQDILLRVHDRVKSLQVLGSSTQIRRALGVIADEVNTLAGAEILRGCGGDGPDRDIRSNLLQTKHEDEKNAKDAELPLTMLQAEVRSEDRRRQMFIDPGEAMQAAFYDYFSGRLDTLELRVSDCMSDIVDAARVAAIEDLKRNAPLISVLSIAESDRKKIAECLRSLAYIYETQDADTFAQSEISLLVRDKCQPISEEAGATAWKENGTVLEQQFRQVFSCKDADSCCGNEAYTKHGPWQWREVWRDTGNSTAPPPTKPPDFVPYPWQNQCQVFPGPVAGQVSSDWGWRTINGQLDFHSGIDIAVPVGTQVLAAVGGRIVWINSTSPGGETGVIVRTGNEIRQYWHVDPDAGLQVGTNISAGTSLGVTANYPRPHLHFARYAPPGGDWTKKSDANSMQPCP